MTVFELASIAAVIVQGLMVWIILPMRGSIDDLREADERLRAELKTFQIDVAKDYIQRSEVSTSLTRMESKIDELRGLVIKRTDDLQAHKVDK